MWPQLVMSLSMVFSSAILAADQNALGPVLFGSKIGGYRAKYSAVGVCATAIAVDDLGAVDVTMLAEWLITHKLELPATGTFYLWVPSGRHYEITVTVDEATCESLSNF